jgi:hypothetical protein
MRSFLQPVAPYGNAFRLPKRLCGRRFATGGDPLRTTGLRKAPSSAVGLGYEGEVSRRAQDVSICAFFWLLRSVRAASPESSCASMLAGYRSGASAPASAPNSRAAHAGQNTATPRGSRV